MINWGMGIYSKSTNNGETDKTKIKPLPTNNISTENEINNFNKELKDKIENFKYDKSYINKSASELDSEPEDEDELERVKSELERVKAELDIAKAELHISKSEHIIEEVGEEVGEEVTNNVDGDEKEEVGEEVTNNVDGGEEVGEEIGKEGKNITKMSKIYYRENRLEDEFRDTKMYKENIFSIIDGLTMVCEDSGKPYFDRYSYTYYNKSILNLKTIEDIINDKMDDNGNTLLIYACSYGSITIIKWLLEYGANINLANNQGITPIKVAYQHKFNSIIKYLENSWANLNLLSDEDKEIVENYLINDLNVYESFLASYYIESISKLDAKNYFMDNKENLYVEYIYNEEYIINRHTNVNNLSNDNIFKMFNELLINWNKMSSYDYDEYETYTKYLDMKTLKDVIDEKIDENGNTLLIYACRYGDDNVVKYLLKFNPNVNLYNNDFVTPIMIAYQYRFNDIVKILLEYGANENQQNELLEPEELENQLKNINNYDDETDFEYVICEINDEIELFDNKNSDDVSIIYDSNINNNEGISSDGINDATDSVNDDNECISSDGINDATNSVNDDNECISNDGNYYNEEYNYVDSINNDNDSISIDSNYYNEGYNYVDDDNTDSINDDNDDSKDIVNDDNDDSKDIVNDDNDDSKDIVNDDDDSKDIVNDDDDSKDIVNDDNDDSKDIVNDDNDDSKDIVNDDNDDSKDIVNDGDGNNTDIIGDIKYYDSLILSSKNGYVDVVKSLLPFVNDVNKVNKDGYTALMFASQNGHLEVVKVLLDWIKTH